MKKYILKSLFVSMLCMLAASCQDTELAETLETTNAQVMFSLAMDSQSARSRSTWDDYKPTGLGNGTYYDNKIDYDQFIVKIEAKDGTTYNVIDIVKSKKGKPEEGKYNEYNFVGTVQTLDGKNVGNLELENAKISVYVNMGKKNISETFVQGADYMPMFGFHTANLKFAPGEREEVKTPIYLLRAMAKIEVALTEELAEEYDLIGVTLNQYNGTGYCLPNSDAISSAQNTLGMSTDSVFNEKIDSQTSLAFVPVEETSSYVVYLPEIAKNENLKVQVELLPEGAPEGTTSEKGSFALMQYEVNEDPKAIDIVRNHWYKYTISGFAESEIQVQYNTLDWQPEKIEIGGDGFLFLNKDVIEIYNSNIDADQLKFSSSSPIKSITLKDSYKHYRNGEIKETPVGETADEVYAYYMNKYGILTQLSDAVLLSNITANVKEEDQDELSGGIVINSPFKANVDAEETTLQSDSHYNTIRYLEFEVENRQGLKATFRVMQYPPVVITNEEGFFSYRDDHMLTDNDPAAHYLNIQGQHSLYITGIQPYHEHDWSDEVNQSAEWHALPTYLRSYSWAGPSCPDDKHLHKWDEFRYGSGRTPVYTFYSNPRKKEISVTYGGGYRTVDGPAPTDYFLRDRYHDFPGTDEAKEDEDGLAIGNPYIGEDGKTYRRHYTWNIMIVYWQKAVMEVLTEDKTYTIPVLGKPHICETCTRNLSYNKNPFREYIPVEDCQYYSRGDNNSHKKNGKWTQTRTFKVGEKTITLPKGSAAINVIAPNSTATGWKKYSNTIWTIPVMNPAGTGYNWGSTGDSDPAPGYKNHRMYHIKTTVSDGQKVIGVPSIVDKDGRVLDYQNVEEAKIGMTENSLSNANKVSPFLAVASELGETSYASVVRESEANGYTVPDIKKLYAFAERHCREYVETTYNDKNNNYKRDDNEPVVHYHDWRLPTKAEIEMIISYQENSRAMDRLLTGQYYYCVTGNGNSDNLTNIHNWVSSEVPNYNANSTGYYIRCVRDVKPEGKNGTVVE